MFNVTYLHFILYSFLILFFQFQYEAKTWLTNSIWKQFNTTQYKTASEINSR